MKKLMKAGALAMVVMLLSGALCAGVLATNHLIDENDTGSIIIHKYDKETWDTGTAGDGTSIDIPLSARGLNGVIFKIYKVDDDVEDTAAAWSYIIDNYVEPVSGTTDEHGTYGDGTLVFNGLEQGIYLVAEEASGGITSVIAPFLVKIPMTNPAGDGLMLDIHVYPKNTTLYITKTIMNDTNQVSSKQANIGDTVTWRIEPAIPADIATLTPPDDQYYVLDTLDLRLDHIGTEVKLDGVTLQEGMDYTLTETEELDGTGLKVDFDKQVGIDKLATAHQGGGKLEINVTTEINETAANDLNVKITNTATLHYKKGNVEIPVEPPIIPEVIVTGLSLIKYDKDDSSKYLVGADFDLYWSATDDDDYINLGTRTTDGNGQIYWGFNADKIEGIGYGYYYVLETKAPAGYELLGKISDVIQLHVDNANGTWKLANTLRPGFNLPTTGGMGTILYTVIGLTLIGGSVFIFLITRKKSWKK